MRAFARSAAPSNSSNHVLAGTIADRGPAALALRGGAPRPPQRLCALPAPQETPGQVGKRLDRDRRGLGHPVARGLLVAGPVDAARVEEVRHRPMNVRRLDPEALCQLGAREPRTRAQHVQHTHLQHANLTCGHASEALAKLGQYSGNGFGKHGTHGTYETYPRLRKPLVL